MDKAIEMVCRPFGNRQGREGARGPFGLLVKDDGSVLVWDDTANHYTRVHSLSAREERSARKLAAERPTQLED